MNLKDAIIAELSASKSPPMAIDPELIDLRLQQLLPTFQTPIHPPYSSMIRQAILKLNEDCGSTEEAISMHLEKEYQGLPWAHASFLSHHLKKLCSSGELVCVGDERYMINVDDGDVVNVEKGDRALVRGKGSEVEAVDGWSGENGDRVPEFEDRCEVERQSAEASARNTACVQRMEAGRESVKEVQEEGLNFSGQIEANHQLNNEKDMVQVDDGDFGNDEMNHGLNVSNSNGKEDQTLVLVKGRELEAIDGWSGVNDDQAVESENQFEVERTEGLEEQKDVGKEPLQEVQEESQNFSGQIEVSHHLEKHVETDCANNEHYMVQVDGDDLEKEDEETSHQLSISDRDEKEDPPLVQVKGKEVEAIDGSNGVNSDQAAESENQCEAEKLNVEVSGQNKTCEQIMEAFEEQNEVAEEVYAAKGKLTKVVQKRRGQKRKRQKTKRQIKKKGFHHRLSISDRVEKEDQALVQASESENPREVERQCVEGTKEKRQAKTKQQRKVLKNDDTPRPTMEVEKCVEERQQQMISKLDHPQDQKIDNRAKMRVLPYDSDVKNLKTSLPKRSGRLLEKQKKAALNHEEQQTRKLEDRKRGLFIVCALPASPSKTNIDPKARKRLTEPRSTSLELSDSGEEILLRQLKRSTPRKPRSRRGNTSKNSTQSAPKQDGMSKNLEFEKQEQQFREPIKLPEYESKTKQAKFGGDKAAVSPSIKVKDSMDQEHQMSLSIVCALPASQSRTNINPKAHMPLTDSKSTSLESRESGEILLRKLKHSTPRKSKGARRNSSTRFTQSEPKPDGMSEGLELEMQEQQANFGSEEAAVSPSIKAKGPVDQEHQMERIKVYTRRSKSQLKEPGNCNILASNS
ncbi:hypothetical protein V6N11_081546 [Hibiscus sabdariffa]|uniref:H15 domain-containing protein n=1 Tax=Hibiscus sabdariffa TaxID=183260 RepID=A0ABR2AAE8_9ROSI